MTSSDGFEFTPEQTNQVGASTDPFPRVQPRFAMSGGAMHLITSEARAIGLQPLRRNHARYFFQPKGYVAFGVDIDLVEGTGQRYVREAEPSVGAWGVRVRRIGRVPEAFSADAEDFTRLKSLLSTDAFRNMPEEIRNCGMDGASCFIEADIEGNYWWKCHWCTEDRVFSQIAEIFRAFSQDLFPYVKPLSTTVAEAFSRIRKYAQKQCSAALKADHVRLFVQRLGFVESAVEIDLASGEMTKYRAHIKVSDHKGEAQVEGLSRLRDLLDSDEFKGLPAEREKVSDEGPLYFIELERGGLYSWKCHWEPDAPVLLNVVRVIEDLARVVVLTSLRASEALSREGLKNFPDSWSQHWMVAYALARQAKFAEAISHLQEARRLEPKDGRPLSSLGEILLKQGKVQEAIQCFETAIKLTPDYSEAVYYLGTALAQAGRAQEAEECIGRAFQRQPELAELHIQKGNELMRLGQAKEAIPYYEQVLRMKPEYSQVHYNLGRALEQMNRRPEAMEHYNQALNCRPDFTSARIALERVRMAT